MEDEKFDQLSMFMLGILSSFKRFLSDDSRCLLSISYTKVFGTHTFYEGEGERIEPTPPKISETVDSTTLNFGRPLELSMRGKNVVELLIYVLSGFHGNCFV